MKKIAVLILCTISVVLITPSSALSEGSSSDTPYDGIAIVKLTVNPELHRPQTLRLSGHVVIQNFKRIGDIDDDGKPDVQTEIVEMNLTGTTPQGLAVNLNSSKSNRSMGIAEQLVRLPVGIGGTNLPADSFFDIFTELSLRHTPFHNAAAQGEQVSYCLNEPIHLQGVTKSLTDLSGTFTQRKSISIIICDRDEKVGTLQLLSVNLNSSKSN